MRRKIGLYSTSPTIRGVMSRPYVGNSADQFHRVSIAKQQDEASLPVRSRLRCLRITGASSSPQTRSHRLEAVAVFCAAPLLEKRQVSERLQRPIPSQGRECQPSLTTPMPSMSPGVAAHKIVARSLSYFTTLGYDRSCISQRELVAKLTSELGGVT